MITIKFGLWIQDHEVNELEKHDGPVFTRWLPNGENDALKISLENYSSEVLLWFERHGYVSDSGFIEYEHKRFEIDENVLPLQAKVYAGALYGKIVLNEVTHDQINSLKEHDVESEEYINLGKFILKKILDPILVKFTKILKNTYGQYWIGQYKPFDSRKLALSNHCSKLNMKWYLHDGESGEFIPGKKEIETLGFTSYFCNEKEYISERDWFNLETLLNDQFIPSVSSVFASRANRLLEEGRYAHSLLESVTAIELSIEEYVRRSINNSSELEEYMKSFWKNPLPTRISLVASLAGVNSNDIAQSISGVTERNKFVHDGKEPDSSIAGLIEGLLRAISYLNENQKLKYPSAGKSNSLTAME